MLQKWIEHRQTGSRYLIYTEAARRMGVHLSLISYLVGQGELPMVQIGNRKYVLEDRVEELAQQRLSRAEMRRRMTSRCDDCEEEKALSEFYSNNHRRCKECIRISRRGEFWRRALAVHGITSDQYSRMFRKQRGKCAICKNPETEARGGQIKPLAVDHCHKTRKIRGLLCHSCNRKLGVIENRRWLKAAQTYLAK